MDTMKIKKANACIALILSALLVIHAGYECISFILMYYGPVISKVTGYMTAAAAAVHAVLSVTGLFILHDSKSVMYIRPNIRTVIQRISALVMALLLPVHIFSFDILGMTAGGAGYVLTEASQVLFYAAMFTHIAPSLGRSLITLGKIETETALKKTDKIMAVICLILFIVVNYITLSTHLKLF